MQTIQVYEKQQFCLNKIGMNIPSFCKMKNCQCSEMVEINHNVIQFLGIFKHKMLRGLLGVVLADAIKWELAQILPLPWLLLNLTGLHVKQFTNTLKFLLSCNNLLNNKCTYDTKPLKTDWQLI